MTQRPSVKKSTQKKSSSGAAKAVRDSEQSPSQDSSIFSVTSAEAAGLRTLSSAGWLMLALILLISFVIRSWGLEIKPIHFDEGINGHFVAKMWREGYYHYDPTNFHGPLYFYVLQLAELLFGKGIVPFRFVTGLISLSIVFGIAAHRRFVGRAAIWAALFIAISPAFTFYSRYAIHESLFIAFQVLFSFGFFMWRQERSRLALGFMVTSFFGMFAVKETFFLFFLTWAIGWFVVLNSDRVFPSRWSSNEVEPVQPVLSEDDEKFVGFWHVVAYSVIGALITILIFTGFLMNPRGIGDMFSALAVWTKTGVGATGHEKPFIYWVRLLWLYEWPFLGALILTPIAYFASGRAARNLIVVGFGTWLGYSLIPYKTPWLSLNHLWVLSFVLGWVCVWLTEKVQTSGLLRLARTVLPVALVVAVSHSLWTSWRMNFRDYAKANEPYVYVQSTNEFKAVMNAISSRVRSHPEDLNMVLSVFNRDPWPMPWVLGQFPNLRWGNAESGDLSGAKVVLIDDIAKDQIEARMSGRWWVLPFQIRESYSKGFAYLDFELFQGIVSSDTPIFEHKQKEMKP